MCPTGFLFHVILILLCISYHIQCTLITLTHLHGVPYIIGTFAGTDDISQEVFFAIDIHDVHIA